MVNKKGGILTKLIKKLIIALTTLATAMTLTTTALAGFHGNVISFTNAAREVAAVYGYSKASMHSNLSWRVDLFVSGREDGTLDPSVDTVKMGYDKWQDDKANFVGSLLYTQEDFSKSTVYIQAVNSTFIRQRSLSKTCENNNRVRIFNLPYMELLEANDETYGSDINKTYVVYEPAPNGLPMDIDGIGSNYTLVQGIVSTDEFTSAIIDKLSSQMSNSGDSLLAKLGTCLHQTIKDKVKTDADLVANLLPTSNNPLVEWCCVVSPMMQYDAKADQAAAVWLLNTEKYMNGTQDIFSDDYVLSPVIFTPDDEADKHATIILDAYGSAQYNYVTQDDGSMIPSIYSLAGLHQKLVEKDVAISDEKMGYQLDYGVLRHEFHSYTAGVSYYENIAKASMVNEDIDPYFSVPCSSTSTNWTDATMARQGGIGIYVTEKQPTKEVPVYYYITPDPNDPTQTDPESVPVDKP